MGKMSEKRKAELQAKYGNALAPIENKYFERARELSSQYILFVNKDNKHGLCECCNKDVEFEKTKHKQELICPNCGTKLTAQHVWRKTNCDYEPKWYVVSQALDSATMVFRYIETWRDSKYIRHASELAREVYDFKHNWSYVFSLSVGDWRVNDRYFFRERSGMSWYLRKECCIIAQPINNIFVEFGKIDKVKYLPNLYKYCWVYKYPRDTARQLFRADLYEKLEKVGLGKFAMNDYEDYPTKWHMGGIKYKRNETSLTKMLGINKLQYKLFLKHANKDVLDFIRSHTNMNYQLMEYVISNDAISIYNGTRTFDNPNKLMKYLVKQGANAYEYKHYLDMLKQLNYKIDDNYLFPKDFRKADDRVTAEINAQKDEELIKKHEKNSELIKAISDGLRKMNGLEEFMNGSRGLLVYVPENAKDLITEGRALHNCIGTYIERVAKAKTLVFFVRKMEKPNDPYIAFEYCNGEVVQCRYDNNKKVEDTKIISFVDAFAERLRKNKVLCAA